MTIEAVVEFSRLEDVSVYITAKNRSTDALDDPTAIVCSITDSEGTAKVTDATMTKNSTGIYEYTYRILSTDPAGTWEWKVMSTDGVGVGVKYTIATGEFDVTEWPY